MASIEIARALEPEEWARQRCGDAAIETVDGEEHLLIRNAAGELVADAGPADLFALIALANHALPDFDPRKISHDDLAQLRDWRAGKLRPDHASWSQRLIDILAALLPPRRNHCG